MWTMGENDHYNPRDFAPEYQLQVELGSMIQVYSDQWKSRLKQNTEWSWSVELCKQAKDFAAAFERDAADLVSGATGADALTKLLNDEVRRRQEWYKNMIEDLIAQSPADRKREIREFADLAKDFWGNIDLGEKPEPGTPLYLVWEGLAIDLAREAVDIMIPDGATRILQLMQLAVEARVSAPTVAFLRRVSRCFIWGFDTECVILCRSAIDTAFRESIDDLLCEQRSERPRHGYTLSNRIEAAHPSVIDKSTYESARIVRDRGDKTVHYDPEATKDILGTIRHCMKVIQSLCR
jgi:hypothetical protein